MKLLDRISATSPKLRLAFGICAAVFLMAIVLQVRSCGAAPAQREAAQARVGQAVAQGTAGAARDATAITGNTMDDMAAVDRQTEANHDTILSGDGSSDTALRALCLRRAYRNQPRCLALLKPGAVANQ